MGRGVSLLIASIGILNALNAMFFCKATSSGRISVAAAMIVIGATTPVMIQLIFKAALAANLLN